ncbi:YigZ family protein [Eubacteriales bacterium KG127]
MLKYKTVAEETSVEIVIDKSRFIAYIKPVETREEAEEFFKKIRKIHRDATHNVPAMVIGDNFQLQWASDDGEPQGTSGVPMMQMLINEGVTNVAIIVSRYFGGIKLGTGGLVRAYTSSAKLALAKAGIAEVKLMTIVEVILSYSYHSKLVQFFPEWKAEILNERFTEQVNIELKTEPENKDFLLDKIKNATGGNYKILSINERIEKN